MPTNSMAMLKSLKNFIRNSVEHATTERDVGQDKVTNSPLYKKLQLELQNMKKNYTKEIDTLKS